ILNGLLDYVVRNIFPTYLQGWFTLCSYTTLFRSARGALTYIGPYRAPMRPRSGPWLSIPPEPTLQILNGLLDYVVRNIFPTYLQGWFTLGRERPRYIWARGALTYIGPYRAPMRPRSGPWLSIPPEPTLQILNGLLDYVVRNIFPTYLQGWFTLGRERPRYIWARGALTYIGPYRAPMRPRSGPWLSIPPEPTLQILNGLL